MRVLLAHLGVLMMALAVLPSCQAGKDKTSSEPTVAIVPPPVAPPALVPIPPAPTAGGTVVTNPQQPGNQGGGPGGNGGGPGAPTDDGHTDDGATDDGGYDDKKGHGGGGGGGNVGSPTLAPVASYPAYPTSTTTTTYSVALPLMELDLMLATSSARRQQRRQVQAEPPIRPQSKTRTLSNTTSATAPSSLDANTLDSALETFTETFLERSHRDTLQRVDLVTAIDSYDSSTGYARVTASNGRALFLGEPVNATDLADTINTYLSFWGIQDLMQALHDDAGLNVRSLNVTLDGVPVQPQVQVVNTGDGTTSNGGGTGTGGGNSGTDDASTSSSESASKANSTLIVVIAVLGTLAVLLVAGTVWIVLKRRNSRAQEVIKRLGGMSPDDDVGGFRNDNDDDTQSYSPRLSSSRTSPPRFRILGTASAGSQSNVSTPNASPHRLARALSDDFRSLSGVVSVEESLFTTTDGNANRSVGGDVVVMREPSGSNSYLQYDPSRLDHVISSARGISQGADP